MTDYLELIAQYEQSCTQVRQRIAELTNRIAGREPLRAAESVKSLQQRRYLLYCELADMEEAIAQMAEYVYDTPQPASVASF